MSAVAYPVSARVAGWISRSRRLRATLSSKWRVCGSVGEFWEAMHRKSGSTA
jgi:hypothetical protein